MVPKEPDGRKHTLVLLLCQHEDGKHQFSSQDSFNEHTLRQTCPRTQRRPHIERRRKQHADKITREDTPSNLRGHEQTRAYRRQSAAQQERKRDSRIEQPAANTEEYPHIDHETEAEDESDVEKDVG